MGKLFNINKIKALGTWGPTDDRWYLPGGNLYGGLGGLAITQDTAMRIITVQNCIRVRAATISLLPIHIYEKLSEDDFKLASNFYLSPILSDQPNYWMQSPIFWSMVEAFVCLRGNFIAYKVMDYRGRVVQLIPITDRVKKIDQNPDYSLTYKIQFNNGEQQDIDQSKILHIRGLLTLDGITGVNPIEFSYNTLNLANSQTVFLNNYFDKGMHPGAVFKHPMTLSAPAHQNLRKQLKDKYEGLGKQWEMMLIDENMTVEFPKITLVDAQYLEIMKMTEAQIAAIYRVPTMLINANSDTPTHSSSEQFMLNYYIMGVAPDVRNYEKTCDFALMSELEKKKYYTKFNIDGLLRGDFKTRMEGIQIGINTEVLNPNEGRHLLDMRPYRGGEIYRTRTSSMKESSKEDNSKNSNNKNSNTNSEE